MTVVVNSQYSVFGSGGSAGVSSLNALTGALSIAAGSNITVTPSGSTVTIAASGTGGFAFNALGDTVYAGPAAATTILPGNTTATREFLGQTGTGSASAAPSWAALTAGNIPNLPGTIITSAQVATANGGTGLDSSAAANGQLLIGTGSGLALHTITAGTGITVTNGPGTITLASTGGFGGNYTAVSDAPYTMLSTDAIVAETTLTATRIITLAAANSVPAGRLQMVEDQSGSCSQTVNISIVRAGSDTIEGGTVGWTIRTPKGWRAFVSDGVSNWRLVSMSEDVQVFTGAGSYSWTKEPGTRSGFAEGLGGGSGGGSGAVQASGTIACGGGAGSGGAYGFRRFTVSDAGATETVTVGGGGAGAAAQASSNSNGNPGSAGTDTVFGTSQLIRMDARGATSGGAGGTTSSGIAGTAGAGLFGGALGGTASATGGGGNPGAAVPNGNVGGGGGAGGGIPAAATPFSFGGNGGPGSSFRADWGSQGAQGNARGSTDGGGGSSATASTTGAIIGGPGGGGGASSILGNGGAGGGGGLYGGGGAGGGAAFNTHSSGAGGAGADGICIVRSGC